jgi:hypothetical protein
MYFLLRPANLGATEAIPSPADPWHAAQGGAPVAPAPFDAKAAPAVASARTGAGAVIDRNATQSAAAQPRRAEIVRNIRSVRRLLGP